MGLPTSYYPLPIIDKLSVQSGFRIQTFKKQRWQLKIYGIGCENVYSIVKAAVGIFLGPMIANLSSVLTESCEVVQSLYESYS